MGNTGKIKLSATLIFTKLIIGAIVLFLIKSVIDNEKLDADVDFKTILECKVCLAASAIGLIYFLTRPVIYHDDLNLYIKKINQRETAIPLKNIKSITRDLPSKGTCIYYIDFVDNDDTIRFLSPYPTDKMNEFTEYLKTVNHHLKIY